jgi:hypothetical protein
MDARITSYPRAVEQVTSNPALGRWIVVRSSAHDYRSNAQGRLELRRPLMCGMHAVVWSLTVLVWGLVGGFFALFFGVLAKNPLLAIAFFIACLAIGAFVTLLTFYRGGLLHGLRVGIDSRTIEVRDGSRAERVDVGEVERIRAEHPGAGGVWRVRVDLTSGADLTLCDCLDEEEATALSEVVNERLGRRSS